MPRRPYIGGQIREHFANGKWHSVAEIAAAIGTQEDHVLTTLEGISKNQTYGCTAEKKNAPAGVRWRIHRQDKAVPVPVLLEQLTPIVKGLLEQGRASQAAI